MGMKEISVQQLQALIAAGQTVVLDVRTPEELALAALPGARHIPLHELPQRFADLNPAATIAVLCHHGVRSLLAARLLEQNGFTDVSSVAGGIAAWSEQIDPSVPQY